jgi:hypothetical protein
MSRIPNTIGIFACVSLLVLQFSGLHLHADAGGNDAGLHVAHLQHVVAENHSHHGTVDAHDHGAETNVLLADQLSASWAKLIALLIGFMIAVLLCLRLLTRLRLAPTRPRKVQHLERWRPPLRAPPISL